MKENFKRIVLKNGFTILFEKRNLPVVSIAFAVREGGINETCEEKGISHFIEHMLYKGTSKRNVRQIAEAIEKNGGELNGFTSEEVTAYWCKIPSKHLQIGLDVLSDLVKNPLFDKKEVEKERKVIFEEIKMYKDNPPSHVLSEFNSCLYTGTMGMNLAGTYETMSSLDRKKLVNKFKKVYAPNNMILCIVGDADLDLIEKFVLKNFGNSQGSVPQIPFETKNEIRFEKRKGIDQANLVFGFHMPLANNPLSHAALCLISLMAGGMSSRLFSEIREKRNLAYAVKGMAEIGKNLSHGIIYFGTPKESVEEIKKLVVKEFKKVSKELKEKELKMVKEQLIGNHQINLENSQEQMVHLLAAEIEGNAERFYDFEKDILAVKLKDVKALAKKVADGSYSFFALIPED